MAKIALVVPVLSNFKGLAETLESVVTKHDWTPIIIPQWRRQQPLSAAWNAGLLEAKEGDYDYALVVNDDILFSQVTIDNLVHYIKNCDPKTVMITGCNVAGEYITNPYRILETDYDYLNKEDFSENPDFSCFLVRPTIFEKIGAFDENFDPAWHEDNDMHRRINLLGYRAGSTASAPYYHFGSVTFSQNEDPDKHKGFENSKKYYIAKWGGYVGEEKYDTPYGFEGIAPNDWIYDFKYDKD